MNATLAPLSNLCYTRFKITPVTPVSVKKKVRCLVKCAPLVQIIVRKQNAAVCVYLSFL